MCVGNMQKVVAKVKKREPVRNERLRFAAAAALVRVNLLGGEAPSDLLYKNV